MSDVKEKIQTILGKPQLAGLATVTEEGNPWVRYMMVATDDNMILRCATFAGSRKVAQIKKNPQVHITCGINDPQQPAPYLQIQGVAAIKTDAPTKQALWSDALATYFKGPDDPNYCVIEITPTQIEYWSLGSHEPELWKP